MSERNQYNEDERIYTTMIDSDGNLLTASTSVLLSIRRDSDGYFYDFNDGSFKASGWTSSSTAMTELDSTSNPGTYYYDLDTTFGIFGSQKNFLLRADCASASNTPQEGYLKLGGWIDSVGLVGGSGGKSSGITKEQIQEIAEKVWKVILRGKETAKDVLLKKSEFDVTKDYVLTKTDKNLEDLLKNTRSDIKKIKFPDNSDKIIKYLDKLKPVDFNPVLEKVLDKIALTVSFFNEGKNDIIKAVESQEKYDDADVVNMIDECKNIIDMMNEDICERIETHTGMTESMKESEEYMSEEHMGKMHEIMSQLETQNEENRKNIKKILLKMTEFKFDSDNVNAGDFTYMQEQLNLILDHLEGKI